jgi:hypothetical protein
MTILNRIMTTVCELPGYVAEQQLCKALSAMGVIDRSIDHVRAHINGEFVNTCKKVIMAV